MRSSLFAAVLSCALAAPSFAGVPLAYVVVTDQSLAAEFAPLAAARSASGPPAEVHTLQQIQALYPVAADDAERVRLHLEDLHATRGLRFVLLGGDDPLVPTRRVLVRLSASTSAQDVLLPTDQYFACLLGTWNADGDGNWGELAYPTLGEAGDGGVEVPELAVGRAPVSTVVEAQAFVAKTLAALAAVDAAQPVSALLAANALEIGPSVLDNAAFAEQLVPILTSRPGTHVARLYQRWFDWPGSFPENRTSVLDSLAVGYDIAMLDGPGGPGEFQAGAYPADLIAAAEFGALANPAPGLAVYLSAYTTQPGAGSVGRAHLLAPGGAALVLGPSDLEFLSPAGEYVKEFLHRAIELHDPSVGEAIQATVGGFGPPQDSRRLSSLGNVLFGDPALPVPGSLEPPVPVRLSLVDAAVEGGAVRLEWFAADAAGPAIVERSTGGEWAPIGEARALGQGSFTYVDRVGGGRYGWRLRVGGETSEETWLTVPGASLALAGFLPNPADGLRTVAFTLSGGGPASLELFDARGRSVARRDVGGLGAGPHAVTLGTGIPAGVYWIRLAQAGVVRTARGVVTR